VKMRTHTASFRFELKEMKADNNQMRQRILKNHLEIAEVSIMQNENLTDILAKICMEIGISSNPTPRHCCIFIKKLEGGTSTRILREEDLNEFDI
jgi:hypothetical protein